jgi:hypothetical protein
VLNTLLRQLMRVGFRRGAAGSRAWMIAGVVAAGARALRHLAHDEPEVAYRTEVKPGDRIMITTHVPE